jgi:hypothetical protein
MRFFENNNNNTVSITTLLLTTYYRYPIQQKLTVQRELPAGISHGEGKC